MSPEPAREWCADITIDNPPVNASSLAVHSGLLQAIAQLDADLGLAAAVLTGTGKTFVAGSEM